MGRQDTGIDREEVYCMNGRAGSQFALSMSDLRDEVAVVVAIQKKVDMYI